MEKMTASPPDPLIAFYTAVLNARDQGFPAQARETVHQHWQALGRDSRTLAEVGSVIEPGDLVRCDIDPSVLARAETGGHDPVTGCSTLGTSVGLVQSLAIPGKPFFGGVVQVGDKTVRCVARRKQVTFTNTEYPVWENPPGSMVGNFGAPGAKTHVKVNRNQYDRVEIGAACFADDNGGFGRCLVNFNTGMSAPDFTEPPKEMWQMTGYKFIYAPRNPQYLREEQKTSTGFFNPGISPGLYADSSYEYILPPVGHGCTSGFAICTPYLRVMAFPTELIIFASVLTLVLENVYHRRYLRDDYQLISTNRRRNDQGWQGYRLVLDEI